jgi:HEPN domain-containing protein
MINTIKQIEYWIEGAKNDLEAAELLIKNGKILHGLFFCHLSIEKAIKAIVVKVTNEVPPRSHNLIYLSEMANLFIDNDFTIFIGVLMKYQLEGRYPDYQPELPSSEITNDYFLKTKQLLQWLENQL